MYLAGSNLLTAGMFPVDGAHAEKNTGSTAASTAEMVSRFKELPPFSWNFQAGSKPLDPILLLNITPVSGFVKRK